MLLDLKVDATTVLVQIVDGIRVNPDFSEEQKIQAEKAMNEFIRAIRPPQKIVGEGAKVM